MRPTRRCLTLASLAALLAVAAVLFDRAALLAGTAGLSAYLLATQYAFAQASAAADGALEFAVAVSPRRTTVGQEAEVTVTVESSTPSPVEVTVTPQAPVATTVPASELSPARLDLDDRQARVSYPVGFPVAGTYELPPLSVTMTDAAGLFSTTVERGPQTDVVVDPRMPSHVHVGRGGEAFASVYGEYEGAHGGSSVEPDRPRTYRPGDPAKRIDWKMTARRDEPFVWEFESDTERQTALVVDHGASMGAGPPGETKLDFAREVGLALSNAAAARAETVGLYTVDDEGLTRREPTSSANPAHRKRSDVLRNLAVSTAGGNGESSPPGRRSGTAGIDGRKQTRTRSGGPLRGSAADAFDGRLRAFLDSPKRPPSGQVTSPLLAAVGAARRDAGSALETLVITDDSDREGIRRAVEAASRDRGQVFVFLTPGALFERSSLASIEAAYERYLDFERFRRGLDALPGVSAYEVGPGDRVDEILGHRRRQ